MTRVMVTVVGLALAGLAAAAGMVLIARALPMLVTPPATLAAGANLVFGLEVGFLLGLPILVVGVAIILWRTRPRPGWYL